jgi:hypothetical protein
MAARELIEGNALSSLQGTILNIRLAMRKAWPSSLPDNQFFLFLRFFQSILTAIRASHTHHYLYCICKGLTGYIHVSSFMNLWNPVPLDGMKVVTIVSDNQRYSSMSRR